MRESLTLYRLQSLNSRLLRSSRPAHWQWLDIIFLGRAYNSLLFLHLTCSTGPDVYTPKLQPLSRALEAAVMSSGNVRLHHVHEPRVRITLVNGLEAMYE
jgi:hypothetical protein